MDDPATASNETARLRPDRFLFGVMLACCLSTAGCLTINREVDCVGGPCLSHGAHVEVLRGISGYWPGAKRFQEQLAQRGISSTVSWCELYPQVADRLIAQKRSNPHAPIVVVGYSLGANHAIRLSRRLQEAGIAVDGLVLLETTYDDTVPSNVRRCFNVYKPRPLDEIPFMRGIPLQADSRGTWMINYDCCRYDDGRYEGLNHLTLCMSNDIQGLLADAAADSFIPCDPTFRTQVMTDDPAGGVVRIGSLASNHGPEIELASSDVSSVRFPFFKYRAPWGYQGPPSPGGHQ